MGGLREKMPVTAWTSFVASMSIAGVPPFNGFFSKLLVICACVEAGRHGFAALAVLGSILTLASFLKVQKYGFMGKPSGKLEGVREAPWMSLVAMVLLAVACVGLSLLVLPGLMDAVLKPAAEALLDGEAYVRAAGLVVR
jgi:multicomponent Na+:H+ antiporter subunit D